MALLTELGLAETARAVRDGSLRASEVTAAFVDRARAHDARIGAFITLDVDGAMAAAEAVDHRRSMGDELSELPLAGVTVAIKDSLCTKNLRTTCGSKMLQQWVPPYDATVVSRLRAAGAIIVGKTNMDEFAMGSSTEHSAFFATHNPWSLSHSPGGSSGGSAAAVSARFAHAALGSDTGGSVRQPAAFTGIVGFKPSYGRVSRYGLIAFASSLDVVSPLALSVADIAALDSVIAGPDPRDDTSASQPITQGDNRAFVSPIDTLRGCRVGLAEEYLRELDSEVEGCVRLAAERARAAGATIVNVSLPHTRHAIAAYYVIAPAEASSNLARFDGVRYGFRVDKDDLESLYESTRGEGFGPEVKRRILLGTFALSAGYRQRFYEKAQKVRALIARDFSRVFEDVDVLLTPTAPTVAFRLGARTADPVQMYLADVCTLPASLAGVPAISLPAGLGAQSSPGSPALPLSVQLIARRFDDARLLTWARGFEALLGTLPSPQFF